MKLFELQRPYTANDLFNKGDFLSWFWRDLFLKASEKNASDIHVEPFLGNLRIRCRVNGELVVIGAFNKEELIDQLIIRLKEIAGLDVSTKNKVQDAAFELTPTKSRYRVALAPSYFGESLVFRIIKEDELPSLKSCNLSETAEKDLRLALIQKQGFICVTGPTGSGKSTTLQACLMALDVAKCKVITLEDPIERRLPGICQQEISEHVTWTSGIKTALRQDPDIIFIGEIRDRKSAELAFEAAQTGHLVLSTLHTNDVAGTVDRLIGLGVERHIIAENLLFVSAQRLLPKLCPSCKILEMDTSYGRGKGCDDCDHQGIKGRIPILEYVVKPTPQQIYTFNKEAFCASQLKQSLYGETKRLVDLGLVEQHLLKQYQSEKTMEETMEKTMEKTK